MGRVILGILKGGVMGVGVGFLAYKVGISKGALAFFSYGLLGALVGVVCGRPLWRQETLWTPALKGLVGFLIGMGLYWVAGKALGGVKLAAATELGAPDAALVEIPFLLAPIIGILYGIFVEVDDGGAAAAKPAESKAGPAQGH